MYPVPESVSLAFKNVVYAKECGVCRICGKTCEGSIYRIVSSEPYTSDNQAKLELFFIQHVGCKEHTGSQSFTVPFLVRHPSILLLLVSFIITFYGGYLFVQSNDPFGIICGVLFSVLAKIFWKAEVDFEHAANSTDSIRSMEQVNANTYSIYSRFEQIKLYIKRNWHKYIGLLIFVLFAIFLIFGVFFAFVYLSNSFSYIFN